MNYFVLMGGAVWLGAALQYGLSSNWRMTIVAVCYALSQFALMGAK